MSLDISTVLLKMYIAALKTERELSAAAEKDARETIKRLERILSK